MAKLIPDPLTPPSPGTGLIVIEGDQNDASWRTGGTVGHSDRTVDDTTWFDLASLTKVMITVPLVLGAMARGVLKPTTTLGSLASGFASSPIGRATVAELLTHTSGAPAELVLEDDLDDALAGLEIGEAGSVLYSDAGFIALGRLLELAWGEELEVRACIFLDEMDVSGDDVEFFKVDSQRWANTGTDPVGVVHDPTARAAGRLLGHAGCFATANGVLGLLRYWLAPEHEYATLVTTALRPHAGRDGQGRRGWGWALQGDEFACAPGWPDTTVSHTGFTGTALAFDPSSGQFGVVLSNAVADGTGESLRWLRNTLAGLAPSRDSRHEGGTV